MLQYKTICVPSVIFNDVTKKEFREGLSQETISKAIDPVRETIEAEAKGGWTLHSVQTIEQTIARKKSLMEKIFGWIPFLGTWLFPTMKQEVYLGTECDIHVLVFVKEEE